jgi:hypothetical protein
MSEGYRAAMEHQKASPLASIASPELINRIAKPI